MPIFEINQSVLDYRAFLRCILVLMAGVGLAVASSVQEAAAPAPSGEVDPPNLLLVTIDTLRQDHLSSYGYPWETSPNLDRVAEEGVLFERAYASIPVTGPSHCTMLSGLQPQTHGSYRNGVRMNDKTITITEILDDLGYQTGAFVSGWTLKASLTGLDRGFDHYSAEFTDRYAMVNSQRPANETTNDALEWLEGIDLSQPFFLWVHYFDPHEPYDEVPGFQDLETTVPPEQLPVRTKKQDRYDQEIAFADAHMGRVLNALQKRGELDDTILIITSDHGESFGEHGYKGHGRRVHEPGMLVPLVVRYPKLVANGRRVDQLAGHLDLAPTILDLLGAEPLEAHQGISLMPWLEIEDEAPVVRRQLHAVAYPGAVGHMPKWVRRIFSRKKPNFPLQVARYWNDWKFVLLPQKEKGFLYDLKEDPGELEDVLGERPEHKNVRSQIVSWFEQTREEEGRTTLTAEDRRHLESLGYAGASKAPSNSSQTSVEGTVQP